MDNDEILLGSGEIYMKTFTGNEIPAHEEIETDTNNVGHCNSGFSIDYKPTIYDVINQYGRMVRRFITKEDITMKTGIISWSMKKLAMLSTANFQEDVTKKTRTLTFGGNNPLQTNLVRFVHTKANGKKIRFTAICQAGNGFMLDFNKDKELTIDAELSAIEKKKNFLAEFEEELSDEEIAEIQKQSVQQANADVPNVEPAGGE